MYSLKSHIQEPLTESIKNLHLDHIEDVILSDGLSGAHIALNFIENIKDSLTGQGGNKNIDVTAKWDGSPAIVCGVDPENGRFFIGTKSVFNKRNPKIIYTNDDIKKYYKDSPGLARQLELVLKHLPKINISGVLQGDLMFTSGEVDTKTIEGEEHVTFKPNTIMYAVPSDSDLAETIRRAKIGIIFHTTYTGDSLKTMSASYKVDINQLQNSVDVWVEDATYKDRSGSVTLTADEISSISQNLNQADKALDKLNPIRFEQLLTSNILIGMIKMYTNQEIRGGKQFDKGYMEGLAKFIEQRLDSENTRDAAKEKKKAQFSQLLKRLESTISNVLEFQYFINEAKLKLISKLHQIESIGTFVSDGKGGYKLSKQGGFVAVDHLTNKAIKLVDRLDFSRTNFARHE